MMRIHFIFLVLLVSTPAMAQQDSPNAAVFSSELVPVLQANCLGCHGTSEPAGGLSVTSLAGLLSGGKQGAAIRPGDSDHSLLMEYVRGERTPRMPLGGALDEQTIAALSAGIQRMEPLPQGVEPFESHLSWLVHKPEVPAIPEVSDPNWASNPIDAFVLAGLEAADLTPAPAASRRAWLRRVYYDLIGLPPSASEVQEFETDASPQAYEAVVDRLLADARYGERWARHWLDLARFAESDGFAIDGERPTAWRYRDYVIRSLNADKPYDQFVKEQIAGDELPQSGDAANSSRSDRLVAMGFLRMGTWEADANFKTQLRQDVLNELTGTVAQVFLGMTVGCARCHDHKYDPIPQQDFYRLQAFFAPMRMDNRDAPFTDAEGGGRAMRDKLRSLEDATDEAADALKEMENSLREQYEAIRPAVAGTDENQAKPIVFTAALKDEKDLAFTSDQRTAWRQATDRARQTREEAARHRPLAYSVADVMPPEVPSPAETYVLAGGELAARGERVEPGFLEAVEGESVSATIPFAGRSSGRRLALAEWIATPDNPLTARVMVNRLWQFHFGEGLVRTPSDFGLNGDRPTHPELLDYLATQFVEDGWSLKKMHRLMTLSSAYRQSTANPHAEDYAEADPKNLLLWRQNWRRLEGEAVRDSLLFVSGQLQPSTGGPGSFIDLPSDVAGGFEFFKWFPSTPEEQARRTIYTFQRRSVMNPMIEVFDGANMSEVCSRRSVTVVPTQAFSLMNGELSQQAAARLAARTIEMAGLDVDAQLDFAFLSTLARKPTEQERNAYKQEFAGQAADVALAKLGVVLFNLNEFIYLE